MEKNFWKIKSLSEFTEEEWEAVCMRCGKCCLFKEQQANKICFTNYICDGYDFKTGNCSRYATRICAECIKVDYTMLKQSPELLPETCPYRLLLDGKELPGYHPLVSGNPNSAHEAKQTVLEIPSIHTAIELEKALEQHMEQYMNGTLEEELEATKKLAELRPVYLMTYDIPANP